MIKAITIAGKINRYGLVNNSAWLSDKITPSDERSFKPKPKYEIVASEKMTLGIIKTAPVIIVPKAFGKMCLAINLASDAPKVRDAKTYSRPLNL